MNQQNEAWRTAKCYQCRHYIPLLPYCPNNLFSREIDDWSGEATACAAFEEAETNGVPERY